MSQRKSTKEERLLFAIAIETEGKLSSPIDVKPLTQRLGFSEKQALKAIHLLARGNFIIKKGEWLIELASHGLQVSKAALGNTLRPQ